MNNLTKFEFGTGSYRPRTDDSKKISNPEWIFKLLQRDGLPEGPACDACSNLILLFIEGGKPRRTVHSRVSKNALQHKEKLPELANSSIKCGLCALMLASCNTYLSRARLNNIVASGNWYSSSEAVGSENEPFRVMLEECFGSGKLISELRVTIRLYPDRHITDNLLRVYTDAENATTSKVQGRPVSQKGSDPRTLQLARDWVEDCYQNHSECRWSGNIHTPNMTTKGKGKAAPTETRADPLLPARVIDIGSDDQQVPRLFLSRGERGKWATLSHRWPQDGGEILRLVTENIEELQRAIPREGLAATFQDAFKVARSLGLRYIWIDSLCIIQNSPADWSEQSSHMPNIYKNAFVTIAAAAKKDSHGGFLGERDWVQESKPFELRNGDLSAASVFFDFPIDRNNKRDAATKTDDINTLAYRAWCFQESLLSHRLLTFDRLQVSFTCLRYCQFESRATVPVVAREYRNEFPSSFRGTVTEADSPGTLQRAIQSWYNVLSDYTNRDLTFSNDKLVAISGIAKVVGAFLEDDYFAGLWRKSLPRGLLWSPYEEEEFLEFGHVPAHEATPAALYRAPSWSWASVDGRISSFLCRQAQNQHLTASVLGISTELNGPDPYGQVKSGRLTVKGPLKKAFCGLPHRYWPYQPHLLWNLDSANTFRGEDISHCIFDLMSPPYGSEMWCLKITRKYGLLMIPQPDTSSDAMEFVRIGVFHLRLMDVDNEKAPNPFSDDDVKTIHIF